MTVDEVQKEKVTISTDGEINSLRQIRSVAVSSYPEASMEKLGMECFTLEPGERAALPVRWERRTAECCSTSREAPQGLEVCPGLCPDKEVMSVVVENGSPLSITVTESDKIAIGRDENEVPTLEDCKLVQVKQETFTRALDLAGGGKDTFKEVKSPKLGTAVVVAVHRSRRFAACTTEELRGKWKGKEGLTRTTTLTYQDGNLDTVTEPEGLVEPWERHLPWCGQGIHA